MTSETSTPFSTGIYLSRRHLQRVVENTKYELQTKFNTKIAQSLSNTRCSSTGTCLLEVILFPCNNNNKAQFTASTYFIQEFIRKVHSTDVVPTTTITSTTEPSTISDESVIVLDNDSEDESPNMNPVTINIDFDTSDIDIVSSDDLINSRVKTNNPRRSGRILKLSKDARKKKKMDRKNKKINRNKNRINLAHISNYKELNNITELNNSIVDLTNETITNNEMIVVEDLTESINVDPLEPENNTLLLPQITETDKPSCVPQIHPVTNITDIATSPSPRPTSSRNILSNRIGNNIYNPSGVKVTTGLRPIFIDGSNVAVRHTNGKTFSVKGLELCIDYFEKRGHVVKTFIPHYRLEYKESSDHKRLQYLERMGKVICTPSRRVGGNRITSYDDRFVIQAAAEFGGIIVSNDNFRDLWQENSAWRETIEKRLLMYTWVGDCIIFPQDPLGKYGVNLDTFLKF